MKILLADDEREISTMLNFFLSGHGYKVTMVDRGDHAVEKLQNEDYDLLLLDYKLPCLNGFEVLTNMAGQNIKTPTIILSGGEKSNLVEKFGIFKNVAYIVSKPFKLNELGEMISSIQES